MNTPETSEQSEDNELPVDTQQQNQEDVDVSDRPGILVPPQCQPISLVFSPNIPIGGGLVTGFVAVKGVASSECPITITSLNPDVLTTQKQTKMPMNASTVPVSAIYTPSGTSTVAYVFASCGTFRTPIVGVVLPQPLEADMAIDSQTQISSLTYPPIHVTGQVTGLVTINQNAGPDGLDVYIQSDSDDFVIINNPVHINPHCKTAEVPTFVKVYSTPYTALVGASCSGGPYGPIEVTVPTP